MFQLVRLNVSSGRKVLETRGVTETTKIQSLEEELKEAQFISEDANRKLEEVRHGSRVDSFPSPARQ